MVTIILVTSAVIRPVNAQYFETLYDRPARPSILDGSRKAFLVSGYSTSHEPKDRPWPSILQEMLHEHAGNESTYFVYRKTISGTPIAKWTTICANGRHIRDAIAEYVEPGTNVPPGQPPATIILAQQSLQMVFDCEDRFVGIESTTDHEHIDAGAAAIAQFASEFSVGGAVAEMYVATHIFKVGDYPLNLCGEGFALTKALDDVPGLSAGPELCELTAGLWPHGYARDQVHPGPEVANAMALYWYIALAGEDAILSVMEPVARAAGVQVPDRTMGVSVVGNPDPESGVRMVSVFPNPVVSHAAIEFENDRVAEVSIELYSLLGQKVKVLTQDVYAPGAHRIPFRVDALPSSGLYVVRLRVDGRSVDALTIVAIL